MHHKSFRIISLTIAAILLLGLSIHPHKAYAQQNWEIDVNTTEDLKDPVITPIAARVSQPVDPARCAQRFLRAPVTPLEVSPLGFHQENTN